MAKYTLMIIPSDGKHTINTRINALYVKIAILGGVCFSTVLGFVFFDYIKLQEVKSNYQELASENEGLRSEARKLMANLSVVKESLKKVEGFTNQLNEIANTNVKRVKKKTGIGPLSNADIVKAKENNVKSTMPLGINLNDLQFNPLFQKLDEVGQMAEAEAMELQDILSNISMKRSLLASVPSIKPVNGWTTSGFGTRVSPFTGEKSHHRGVDVAAPVGTPILSPADGVVIFSGAKVGFGNFVMIAHGYGIVTRYGHNAQNLVQPGQKVKRGDKIATVGMTGRTTGPHLHYEVWVNGRPANPKKFMLEKFNFSNDLLAH